MQAVGRSFLLSALAATASYAGPSATADIIDHVTAAVSPATYDGPCPVLITLSGVVSFDVVRNTQEQYFYRWEGADRVLSDDETALSKGRRNHVETMSEIQEPIGRSVTLPVVLHAWRYVEANYGKTTADRYSDPVNLTVTCR